MLLYYCDFILLFTLRCNCFRFSPFLLFSSLRLLLFTRRCCHCCGYFYCLPAARLLLLLLLFASIMHCKIFACITAASANDLLTYLPFLSLIRPAGRHSCAVVADIMLAAAAAVADAVTHHYHFCWVLIIRPRARCSSCWLNFAQCHALFMTLAVYFFPSYFQ